jgi:hypothetical protein
MVAVGAVGHIDTQAIAPLIAAGAALAAAALIFPHLRSFDFGIFKAEIEPDAAPSRKLQTDAWKLQRFAWLVCGDATDARNLVEEALAETRASRLPPGERGVYTLKSLVVLLENVQEHAWLQPPPVTDKPHVPVASGVDSDDCRPTMETLARLPVRVRVAYLLHCSWLLPLDEVVKIVAQTPGEVSEAITQGREALKATQ